MGAALVLTLGAPLLQVVGCGVEPDQLDTKGPRGELEPLDDECPLGQTDLLGPEGSLSAQPQEGTSNPQPANVNVNMCVTVTGSAEWCGPTPATYRFAVCGPNPAARRERR